MRPKHLVWLACRTDWRTIFYRTVVRNLERAGVARSAAMKMTGHKKESMCRRYAIVDEAMLKESVSKRAAFHADEKKGTGKVVSVSRRRPQ